jgi:WD40 repeat protein
MRRLKWRRRELALFLAPLLVLVPLAISMFGQTVYYRHHPRRLDHGHDNAILDSLGFLPDGNTLYVVTAGPALSCGFGPKDRWVQLWSAQDGAPLQRAPRPLAAHTLSFATDGRPTFSIGYDAPYFLQDPHDIGRSPNEELVAYYSHKPISMGALLAHPDWFRGRNEQQVEVRRAFDSHLVCRLEPGDIGHSPGRLAFLDDNTIVTWGSKALVPSNHPHTSGAKNTRSRTSNIPKIDPQSEGRIQLWSIAPVQLRRTIPCEIKVQDFRVAPDRQSLATTSLICNDRGAFIGSVITLFDARSGATKWQIRNVHEIPNGGTLALSDWAMSTVEFSPDGTILAAGGYGGYIHLLDSKTGRVIRTLHDPAEKLFNASIHLIAFSPDGQKLATTQLYNPVVKLWDISHEVRAVSVEP